MNKTYILIEFAITGVGGVQLYIQDKLKSLENRGWKCLVFSGFTKGIVELEHLKKHQSVIFPELAYSPVIFPNKDIKKIIRLVKEAVGDTEEIVIESGSLPSALWGELIAEALKAKHIVFLLSEENDKINRIYIPFFKFKLERKELAGTNSGSLPLLFYDEKIITESNNLFLSPSYSNQAQEYNCDQINQIPDNKLTITSIGRLNKKTTMPIINGIEYIIKHHPDKSFCIVIVGSSTEKDVEKNIQSIFEKYNNVSLFVLGTLNPLPKSLFRKTTLFISSAGSALISYKEGIPTISVDANDCKAIGVLGYTTSNSLYRKNETPCEIGELAELVLFGDYLNQFQYHEKKRPLLLEDIYSSHDKFIIESDKTYEYFPLLKLKLNNKQKIAKIAVSFWGIKALELYEFLKRV